MNLNDLFNEEKVRLDPKCWTGKKIGNPKTKMKGGTRVNNCVPAESVNEMDKSQTPPGRDGSNDSDAGKKEYTAKATTPKKVAKHGEKILNKVLNKKKGVAEEYELAGVGVAYELGRRAYKERKTARDNPYSATREARKNDEWAKGLERGKHDANAARHFRSSVREQGVAEATGDQKFDSMMSRMTTEPKYPDREMPPTSIAELVQWADQNNKPYHKFFAQWAQKHRFTNVNDALVWVGDNVDPYDEFGPKDHENDFGDLVGEPLIDAAKRNPKAAELLKVFKCYEEIVDDWGDDYRQMNMAEGKVEPQVDHRGDVDLDADIEVLGVDYNTGTWKITYNGKPYTVKADYFSREDLNRWQIPDYDVEIINRNGKNIMKVIDWDNEGSSKTDRQIRMVNTIIAYLDTENAQDIQYMAWKDQELDNVTAYEFYNDIKYFYNKDQQKIDQTVQWLLKNMTDDEAREGLADYIKNPVNPMDWRQNLKNNRTYMLYMAFSYSREGNTEMTPGMNLPKIQLNDPDDEDELQYQLDALFKKVDLKFDAFENKIVELSKKFSLPNPDLGSGMGNREMFWELICQTAWPKEYKYTQNAATNILNFKAAVDKYAKSFNSSLIKIGLPGISEYAIWYGVLSDDLTEQQVNYFATPEGFANVANGKIDVSKMINDNMQRKSLEEKLGDNRPKLGSKRDSGKSVRKWRSARGLDETGVAEGELDEGWKSALGAAALAGTMAMGAGGASARVMPGDDPSINRLTGKPIATQQATDTAPAKAEAPQGFSKEYLQKAANPDRFGRFLISVEKAQELLKQMNEGDKKAEQPEADYGDDYQDMVARVKKLAGLGPLKTVYDPNKRVYRNIPSAVQPKK